MTNSFKRVPVLAAFMLSVLAPTVLAGRPARFVSIDYPEADETYAYGINPAGDVVGGYVKDGDEHGFVLSNGAFTSFDYPGTDVINPGETNTVGWTVAFAITPQGDIVGQYGFTDGRYHGFLLRGGQFLPIDAPGTVGEPNTMPIGMSASGTIAGCVHGGAAGMHGFVRTADGGFEVQGPTGSMHTGINSSGSIVGYGGVSSYVVSDGVRTSFMVPDSTLTNARAISDSGAIVGVFQDKATSKVHGFLLREGEFVSIDVPTALATRAMGINPRGDVVGYYKDANGAIRGFLRTTRTE